MMLVGFLQTFTQANLFITRCSTTASALVFQTRYGGAAPLTGSIGFVDKH